MLPLLFSSPSPLSWEKPINDHLTKHNRLANYFPPSSSYPRLSFSLFLLFSLPRRLSSVPPHVVSCSLRDRNATNSKKHNLTNYFPPPSSIILPMRSLSIYSLFSLSSLIFNKAVKFDVFWRGQVFLCWHLSECPWTGWGKSKSMREISLALSVFLVVVFVCVCVCHTRCHSLLFKVWETAGPLQGLIASLFAKI